jgi:O-antigen/teichoic acid export membrane protein
MTQVAKLVISVFASLIVARTLGPVNFGKVAFLIAILAMYANLAPLGVLEGHRFFFGKKYRTKRQHVFNVNLSFALLMSGLGMIFFFFGKSILFPEIILPPIVSILVGVSILATMTFPFLSNTMFILGKVSWQNRILLWNRITFLLTILVLYGLGRLDYVSYLAVYAFFEIVLLIRLLRKIPISVHLKWDGVLLRREMQFGIILFVSIMCMSMIYRIDMLFLKYLVDYSSIGVYAVATTLTQKIWLIPVSVGTVLSAKLLSADDSERNLGDTIRTAKASFWLCSAILLIIFLVAHRLILTLYGVAFLDGARVIQILVPGVALMSVGQIINQYLLSEGSPMVQLKIALLIFVINIVLNLILIPSYGIIGAAVSSTFSYALFGLLSLAHVLKYDAMRLLHFFVINKRDLVKWHSLFKNFLYR